MRRGGQRVPKWERAAFGARPTAHKVFAAAAGLCAAVVASANTDGKLPSGRQHNDAPGFIAEILGHSVRAVMNFSDHCSGILHEFHFFLIVRIGR